MIYEKQNRDYIFISELITIQRLYFTIVSMTDTLHDRFRSNIMLLYGEVTIIKHR